MAQTKQTFHFDGFESPNTTPVPDVLFDELIPQLKDAELRVLLYIIRRTYGFKKSSDNISLRQLVDGITTREGKVLDRGTGLSKATVARGLAGLRSKQIIQAVHNRSATKGDEPTTYRLRFKGEQPTQAAEPRTPVSHQRDTPPVSPVRHPLSHQRDTQETGVQETDNNLSNIRRIASVVDNSAARTAGADAPPQQPPKRRGGEPEAIGATLSRLIASQVPLPPPAPREAIAAYISEVAREFGDRAPLKSSVTRACRLQELSGREVSSFIDAVFQARARTRERLGLRNRMSYFFSVLADEVGVDEPDSASQRPNGKPARPGLTTGPLSMMTDGLAPDSSEKGSVGDMLERGGSQ